ncbi:hypothetical protein CC86DRAFT_403675 [Ophiobolus disseminans]|uniref:Uncharacterized protein n=1 Tax=Ophiobolus disseminans TaxID=1469910 RepID=A0A6A7A8T9_9PLEO|nr:hypothetical protein CC86DRAFT_403675 [Ophiobolus disseminans]
MTFKRTATATGSTESQENTLAPIVERAWTSPNANTTPNNLLHITAQYPILEPIVAHLQQSDLLALAQTCQTLHRNLTFDHPDSKANLLKKTLCSGHGVKIRCKIHRSPQEKGFGGFESSIKCGGKYNVPGMESRPCTQCGVTTCDECRIHVTYQSLVEDPGLDTPRWWAGYVLGYSLVVRLFPPPTPKNTAIDLDGTWNAPLPELRPQHDQGRIGVHFDCKQAAKPEPVKRLLDINLGRRLAVEPQGVNTGSLNGRSIVAPLHVVITRRILRRCLECFEGAAVTKQCDCTLRKHFLDRWLCVGCYKREEAVERAATPWLSTKAPSCVCLKQLSLASPLDFRVICNWCKGEIIDEHEAEDSPNDGEASDAEEEDVICTVTSNGGQEWINGKCFSRRLLLAWHATEGERQRAQEGHEDLRDDDEVLDDEDDYEAVDDEKDYFDLLDYEVE